MTYSEKMLDKIYRKTGGYCTFCGIKLSRNNYGGDPCWDKGSWEVDHGIPRSRGGTNDFKNLQPVCALCNREKSTMTTREFREKVRKYKDFRRYLRRKYCGVD